MDLMDMSINAMEAGDHALATRLAKESNRQTRAFIEAQRALDYSSWVQPPDEDD